MISDQVQRWGGRRERHRPAGELIDPSRYGAEPLDEPEAKAFVLRHHYSGSFPAAVVRVGLYRRASSRVDLLTTPSELVGVAVFSVPMQGAAIPRWTGTTAGLELGRFVLLPDVPGNGETWFLGQAFGVLGRLRPELRTVLAYSDPMMRRTVDGDVVMPGHVGTIYQGHNGRHVGRGKAEWRLYDRDGRELNRRAITKIRNDEQGARYAYERFVEQGAPRRHLGESGPAYVRRAVAEALAAGTFRRARHPGCLAYAWPIGADRRSTLAAMPAAQPYLRREGAIVDLLAA